MRWLGNRYVRRTVLVIGVGFLAAVSSLPAGGVEAEQADVEPLWPLDLPTRYLTSNFMEYRSGRFHAGLDLKTQSKSGFAARAVENGSIVRVRATPFAYGRAIYLLGESGRTYVYAHLSRFNDPLRVKVRAAQARTGKYRVALHFAPGEWKVRRGEVLGLTGESGAGGPHLHFEVRDPDNGPVNPLARGFAVPDTFAPVIHAVRVVPADPRSRIHGLPRARIIKSGGGNGLTGDQPQLLIAGPVAFAAKIIDAGDIAGHKLEPWLIEVRLDGEIVYRCSNDRFDFSENSLQRLEWLEVPGIKDHWLHRRLGNSLSGRTGEQWYQGPRGKGLEPGPHTLEISAADYAGNATLVKIPLLAADLDYPQPPSEGGWLQDPVEVVVDSLSGNILRPLLDDKHEDRLLRRLDPDMGDPVLAPTTLAIIPAEMEEGQLERARRQGLEPVGPSAKYLAADWPIDAAVVVDLTGPVTAIADTLPPEKDPAVMVYRWGWNNWSPDGRLIESLNEGANHRFALSNPGFIGVFRDVAPPIIFPADSVITVTADSLGHAHGVTLPRWEVFPVDLVDLGSGIAPESITATLDGQVIILEPDLPRDRVLVELPDDISPGRHVLILVAEDKAENESEAEVVIDCRQ
jgi:hypothetical protein